MIFGRRLGFLLVSRNEERKPPLTFFVLIERSYLHALVVFRLQNLCSTRVTDTKIPVCDVSSMLSMVRC